MAWWGVAFALGPNYNLPLDAQRNQKALEAVQKAQSRTSDASDPERQQFDGTKSKVPADFLFNTNRAHDLLAIAYSVLQQTIIRAQGHDSILKKAVGHDWKGKLSPVLYVVAIVATLRSTWIAQGIYVVAALIWLIPDRRIKRALQHNSPGR